MTYWEMMDNANESTLRRRACFMWVNKHNSNVTIDDLVVYQYQGQWYCNYMIRGISRGRAYWKRGTLKCTGQGIEMSMEELAEFPGKADDLEPQEGIQEYAADRASKKNRPRAAGGPDQRRRDPDVSIS